MAYGGVISIEIVIRNSSVRVNNLTHFCPKTSRISTLKQTGYTDVKQVIHGDWRDDRPPHGRGGRASTDGLAACR